MYGKDYTKDAVIFIELDRSKNRFFFNFAFLLPFTSSSTTKDRTYERFKIQRSLFIIPDIIAILHYVLKGV